MEKEPRELNWCGSEQDRCILGWLWSISSNSRRMLPEEVCWEEAEAKGRVLEGRGGDTTGVYPCNATHVVCMLCVRVCVCVCHTQVTCHNLADSP